MIRWMLRLPQAWRVRYADRLFMQGRYADAWSVYAGLTRPDLLPWVRRQLDWICYKQGEVSCGWPLYPGNHFDLASQRANARAWTGATTVVRANRPYELHYGLGLKEWDESGTPDKALLIWFNFDASVGGELFNCKIIKAFCRRLDFPVVLAVDPRLRGICQRNFPGCKVISKSGDLGALRDECSHFMLSRNALRHVVRAVDDFDVVARETLDVARTDEEAAASTNTARVAISWKTTNKRQGVYRNLPVQRFAEALSRIEGVEFYSVQHGLDREDVTVLERHLGRRIVFDAFRTDGDVGEFASHLSALDGVLTIDNTVLHVAGAIGLPAVAMLSVPSYWMWPEHGVNSRWYPSVRLVHQAVPGRWDDVIERLDCRVREMLRERKGGQS